MTTSVKPITRMSAHAEGECEHPEPEVEHTPVDGITGHQSHPLNRRQPRSETDGERREDDMEADDEGELHTRQQNRIEFHLKMLS
jgi:hypothetical protein